VSRKTVSTQFLLPQLPSSMRSPKEITVCAFNRLQSRIYLRKSQSRWDKPDFRSSWNEQQAMFVTSAELAAHQLHTVDQAPHFHKQIGIFGGDRSQPDLSCSPAPAHFAADFPAQSFTTHTVPLHRQRDCRQTCMISRWNTSQNDLHITAPIGMPPPKPLALVKTSGSMPRFSYPQNFDPCRTSSHISKCRFHRKFCGIR